MTRSEVFPLRFKNPRTRAALKLVAEQSGMTMTAVAEKAIEHEVALMGADLERRLSDALEVVRSYQPERDLDTYVEAVAEGERSGLDPTGAVRAAHAQDARQPAAVTAGARPDRFGVLAAFGR